MFIYFILHVNILPCSKLLYTSALKTCSFIQLFSYMCFQNVTSTIPSPFNIFSLFFSFVSLFFCFMVIHLPLTLNFFFYFSSIYIYMYIYIYGNYLMQMLMLNFEMFQCQFRLILPLRYLLPAKTDGIHIN